MKLMLASSSPYRQALLRDVGVHVSAVGANIDEYSILGQTPVETAKRRAFAKAQAVCTIHSDYTVIGADQVCYIDDIVLDKPRSSEEWFARLKSMRGRPHSLSTAVCLVHRLATGEDEIITEFVETTKVYFRSDLSDDDLQSYVNIGEARQCAGGYMMERRGAWLIEKIEGDWQNVIGLPIFPLLEHLKSLGVPIFGMGNIE
jgi:septum formation protein